MKLINTLVKTILISGIMLVICLFGVLFLFTDSAPLIRNPDYSPYAPKELKQLLGPLKSDIIEGKSINLNLTNKEITLVTNTVNLLSDSWNLRMDLIEESLIGIASMQHPETPLPRYLNIVFDIKVSIKNSEVNISINELKVSNFNFPRLLYIPLQKLLRMLIQRKLKKQIQNMEIRKGQLDVTFLLNAVELYKLAGGLRKGYVLTTTDIHLLAKLTETVINVVSSETANKTISLSQAIEISYRTFDRQAATRINLKKKYILSMLALGNVLGNPVTLNLIQPLLNPKKLQNISHFDFESITLHGRHDLARHFVFSFSYSVIFSPEIADMVGLSKEVLDFENGGFSFSDLQADRAGVFWAKQIQENSNFFKQYWHKIVKGIHLESLVMSQSILPVKISKQEFIKRFDHIHSTSYQTLISEIDLALENQFRSSFPL